MGKKRRSSRQKAATRKLVALNRRRASKPRKRRKSQKVKKRIRRRSPVARRTTRRRSSGGGKKSLIDKIPILNNKTVQKVGFGLGMGALAGIILNFIPIPQLQQNKALIQTGVTFVADPLAGVLRLTGLLGGSSGLNLGNLLGGQNQSSNGMPTNTGGFA